MRIQNRVKYLSLMLDSVLNMPLQNHMASCPRIQLYKKLNPIKKNIMTV